MPLHQHIAKLGSTLMDEVVSPVSLVNVINAGNHAGNRPARQEFVILPVGATSFRIAVLVLCLCRSKRDAASPVHRQARQQAHGYLKQLKERATKHADDEGEMFLDSLGQMKKASKGELFENAVTHRCYAFWMLGVFTDHYMRCYSDAAFCTILERDAVRPWSEMLVRSFGNDQDLFGCILLGSFQDARPEEGESLV